MKLMNYADLKSSSRWYRMAGFEHEKIRGAKIYFGQGITEKEKEEIREWFKKGHAGATDTHFWKSDSKIRFQQVIGKEYVGYVCEIGSTKDLAEGKLKVVM